MNNVKNSMRKMLISLKERKYRLAACLMTAVTGTLTLAVPAFAEADGDAMFQTVIDFFATWIGRIGLIVGFIGAIMFGLAIKNDDADAKTRGLMTLAAGFVVFAVTKAVDMFVV